MKRIIKYWNSSSGVSASRLHQSLLLMVIFILVVSYTNYRPNGTIIINNVKYYKCFTDYTVDTTEEPNGYVIEKTSHTYYDKDKCKDVNH